MTGRDFNDFLINELLAALEREQALIEENTELVDEVRSLDLALQVERSRRCIGGSPAGYQNPAEWNNRPLGSPDTAFSSDAPPLRRGLS